MMNFVDFYFSAEMTQDGHCLVLPMSDEAAQRSIGSSSESHTDSMHESPRGKVLQSRLENLNLYQFQFQFPYGMVKGIKS